MIPTNKFIIQALRCHLFMINFVRLCMADQVLEFNPQSSFQNNSNFQHPEEYSKPNYLVCWENHVDAIVALANGKLYAVKHRWAWQLKVVGDKLENQDTKDHRMGHLWKNVPEQFDFVFTVPRMDHTTELRTKEETSGITVFVNQPQFYAYHNFDDYANGSMRHWDEAKFFDTQFVITMHRSYVVLLTKDGAIPDAIKKVTGNVFAFDSIHFPEHKGPFELNQNIPNDFKWLKMKQMLPLDMPTSKGSYRYLAVFEFGSLGTHYCMFSVTGVNVQPLEQVKCTARPISEAFPCPTDLISLGENNWAHFLWRRYSLSLHRLIICLTGTMAGLLWINIYFAIRAYKCFCKFYSANIKID